MQLKNFLKLFLALLIPFGISAQVTTSSISGTVTTEKGEPLQSATVTATHVPSGSVYSTLSTRTGTFNLSNLRVGGPYRLTINFVGFNPAVAEGFVLELGQPYQINLKMGENLANLGEVVVSGSRGAAVQKTGASTNISTRALSTLPTVSRSLTDFTRLTPQAFGNNFAGRDGRMNAVTVDGATMRNSFGLSTDLLPGGDAQPISLDAVQEVQVNIAPYDVRQTGFTGAGVNAVTRSGTNTFSGSVYGYYRDQSFNGKKVGKAELPEATKSTNKIYGARIGGPIIKNKLFFFGNFEKNSNVFPGNTWLANRGTTGPNVARTTATDLEAVKSYLMRNYNYDPGAYENYANEYKNEDTKFLIRIDYNITAKHKFNARYNQVIGTSDQGTNFNSGPNPRSSTGRISSESIAFEKANYKFRNVVQSASAELNSTFNSKLSNQLLTTYTYIEALRSTPGELFPYVDIWEAGSNYMSFGTELFSFNNGLKNHNFSIIDNVTYQAGKHTLTGGVSFEKMSFDNSFVRMGTSYYRYDSVEQFLAGAAPSVFGITYPYQSDTYAKVKFGMGGLYVQDKITVNDRLNVTVGVRADLPLFFDKPLQNRTVDTLKLLDENGNPTTYSTAAWPKSRVLMSPRIGFNYNVLGDRTLQLRGGTGIFTGLIPFVWFTNQPTNSGVLQNTFEPVGSATLAKITRLERDPYHWVKTLPSDFPSTPSTRAPGTVALIDEDFRMPQIFRTNLGADYKIPNTPLVATFDFIYSKDINGVYQFNANRKQATQRLNYSGDYRAFWGTSANATYNTATGSIVPVLSNTNKGYSTSITAGVSLPYRKGLYGSLFYTHTASKDITGNPGSSAGSAWSNNYSLHDPNEQLLGYSQYGIPHRIVGNISYRVEWLRHFATTVSLLYQGSHAGRFAWTYDGDINRDGVSLDLLYIPNNVSEITFVTNTVGGVTFTPAQQATAFEQFVNNHKSLSKARGGYVERNAGLLPWHHRFDFKLLQDLFTNIGKQRHTLQLSVDILNFGNFIDSEWGIRQELNTGSSFNYALLRVAGVSASGVPTFTMATTTDAAGKRVLATSAYRDWFGVGNTWSMQVGLRYSF